MNSIEQVVQEVDARIARLQALRLSLVECSPLLAEVVVEKTAPDQNGHGATPPRLQKPAGRKVKLVKLNGRPRRKFLERAPANAAPPAMAAERVTALLEKPTTLGGAMKRLIAGFAGPFTSEQVYAALRADADFAALLEASPTGVAGNLGYWSEKSGKLKKSGTGDKTTYAVIEHAFFAPE